MNVKTGVYRILNLETGDCYIGSCSSRSGLPRRFINHRRALKKKRHHSVILQRAWDKYGPEKFVFEVLEECFSEKCIEREQWYLDHVHPKYNVLQIAGSCLGRKLSPEHIQKLKDRSYDWMKGDRNCNCTPERKELNRQRLLRFPLHINDEGRRKISEFHKGKPKSELHRQRISEALKKRKQYAS